MTYKMTADQRRREWAKLAVLAGAQTGDKLPSEIYKLAREDDFHGEEGARPALRVRGGRRGSRSLKKS